MLDDHLADIGEQAVEHEQLGTRNDKLTTGQISRTWGKGSGRFMFPSYAARRSDELDGPCQSVGKRGVGNWLCLTYEAELVLDVGEEEIIRSAKEKNDNRLGVDAKQEKGGNDGYGRKKHPSVWRRLSCDASNLDNVEEGEEDGNEVHGR